MRRCQLPASVVDSQALPHGAGREFEPRVFTIHPVRSRLPDPPVRAEPRAENPALDVPTKPPAIALGEAPADAPAPPLSPPSPGGLIFSVIVGLVLMVPLGWLLSYGAALPTFLGLFFFALFGLVIGAAMYRAAGRGRPRRRASVLAATLVVVSFGVGLTVYAEARDFPSDIAEGALRERRVLAGRSVDQFRNELAGAVNSWLSEKYAPGGTWGYMRWIVSSGRIDKSEIELLSKNVVRSPSGKWWCLRVALSALLLAFGIGSQTMLLTKSVPPALPRGYQFRRR